MSSRKAIDPKEYDRHFNELVAVCDAENDKHTCLEQKRTRQLNRKREIEIYLERLKNQNNICDFEEDLFNAVVDKVTVYNDKLVFMFRDGTEMKYELK